jgi:hypothetical protein
VNTEEGGAVSVEAYRLPKESRILELVEMGSWLCVCNGVAMCVCACYVHECVYMYCIRERSSIKDI